MRKFSSWLVLAASALLTACGGGGGSGFQPPLQGPGSGPPAQVASVSITSDKATILNDGSETALITAFVRDANNVLIEGVPVTFGASSGALQVTVGTTGGQTTTAQAVLGIGGNTTARPITVTATVGNFSGSVIVNVGGAAPGANPTSITLQSTTTTIPSDGSINAEITAFVRDGTNRFMQNVPVTFSSTTGGLTVVRGTTDASGTARVDLSSAGDPTNRTITVTANAGAISSTINVDVTGSVLNVTGPSALVLNQRATYTVSLLNSGGRGIAGRAITVTSSQANTLTPSTATTDSNGRANFDLTITRAGNDVLTVTGLGLTRTQNVSVNADSFNITTPAADGLEIPLATPQTVTVTWLTGGAPVVGQTVNFSTSRGTYNGTANTTASATTDGSGQATVTVQASNAGGGVLTATAGTGTATASRVVEFISTVAAAIDVQPGTFTLAPTESTSITAVVRDSAGNLVKNKSVSFGLDDVTGGTLSAGSATTDSQGRAQVVYTASSTTSATNGVVITATVQGAGGPISDTVALSVSRREVFISLGTGNEIFEPNTATYRKEYIVIVTDSNGNAVPNVTVNMSLLTLQYMKGYRVSGVANCGAARWCTFIAATCDDEDVNRNGVLDQGEDFNGNGRLTVGNVASTTRQVVTRADGSAIVDILYPQEWAYYANVRLEARTTVQGTEFARAVNFVLEGLATDFDDVNDAPPGPVSPAGQANTCSNPN